MHWMSWAAVTVGYLPFLVLPSWRSVWAAHWRSSVILVAACLLLIGLRARDDSHEPLADDRDPGARRTLWLLAAWIVLALAVLLQSPSLAAASAVMAVRALLLELGAARGQDFTVEWLLLWLLVPLPRSWDAYVDSWFQRVAVHLGSYVLDFCRVPNLAVGTTILLPGQAPPSQQVSWGWEACVLFVALAAAYAIWLRRPRVHAALLLASAACWSVAIAVFRVSVVVHTIATTKHDLTVGWLGPLADVGLVAAGMILLVSMDQLLLLILLPSPAVERLEWDEESQAERDEEAAMMVARGARWEKWLASRVQWLPLSVLAGSFVVLGLIQFAVWIVGR